ncbi:catalase/peroxidase HPI [Jannaschia aquimarina]|uniref:Catalase-peroxidase n=1 Tax=Jannaschia aquimarina TaxID=935700 RepID=A0A0D1EIA8_9RHOB|nr:catalase/peroxidase HPI [Jannaschia aquimarina]KIT17324.1 Catalase-peroxidase [Jannaschia aquimarina]SNT20321.1 catalase-peroxidase [Jannaschia aquimarina]
MKDHAATQGACPFRGTRIGGAQGSEPGLDHWWPNRLKVELLYQDPPQANPLGRDFDYADANAWIDHDQLWEDVRAFLHKPVEWWPSDYGHYGPQMNRMSWHSAGTYRIADGRGGAGEGMQRFAPINSWWDNGNTDKSRRLLAPIKAKYGAGLSWADLIALAGTVALEDMGLPLQGFAFGREDAWSADTGTYWGPEGWFGKAPTEQPADPQAGHPDQMVNRGLRWQGGPKDQHYDLENPLGASHQSLIYVDPEGPGGNGDPMDAARDIRETFARMAMNDEETVALVAGGHAFGKSHGAVPADKIGGAPEIAKMSEMGLGWANPVGEGNAENTMTNGIEGSWTPNPTRWDNDYLTNLFKYEWKQTKSPAGSLQWTPTDPDAPKTPDAHLPGVEHPLMMMTTDLAFKVDPDYRKVCERFLEDFDYFTEAFSKAWHKLMHRDLGPTARWLGPRQGGTFLWQDPVPEVDHPLVDDAQVADLKARVLETGLAHGDLIAVAWASASTYRDSDKRGGANGARVRLAPQRGWAVNDPARLDRVIDALEGVKADFEGEGEAKISLADLIVLAGCAGVEAAAQAGGHDVTVPFVPGRTDASDEWTDAESFDWLKPVVDGFRNYVDEAVGYHVSPEGIALDKACLLKLTAPEWAALTGGLRVLDQNWDGSKDGVFTDRPGVLSADFFRVLTDTDLVWRPETGEERRFTLERRDGGGATWTATRLDLVFGANAELRQIAELYAGADGEGYFMRAFVKAWHKVMMLDRFDAKEARKAALSDC